jgi:hypothetical protein
MPFRIAPASKKATTMKLYLSLRHRTDHTMPLSTNGRRNVHISRFATGPPASGLRRYTSAPTPLGLAALLAAAPVTAVHAQQASVTTRMRLSSREVTQLDQLYGEYARVRLAEEGNIRRWQTQMAQEQAKLPPDLGRIVPLLRYIKSAEQRVAIAYSRARTQAIQRLLPNHRPYLTYLQGVSSEGGRLYRDDKYRQLLIANPLTVLQMSIEEDTARQIVVDQFQAERAHEVYSARVYRAYHGNRPQYGNGYNGSGFQPFYNGGYDVYNFPVNSYPAHGWPLYYAPSYPTFSNWGIW